ncbi:MAG: HEAT repeat domain-containing protein [Desulfobacterales bacterium]|jgi:hypothetical protein
MNQAVATHRALKKEIRALLQDAKFATAMSALKDYPARKVVNPLISFFCSSDMRLRWRAISGMGVVVSHLADAQMESARVIMRRLMWTLNDESGGIGWGAPEAMGDITARHKALADEFGCILVSYIRPDCNFLEHPILQRGVLWGLGRLAHVRAEMVVEAVPFIRPFLDSDDAVHRGLAAWALRAVDDTFRMNTSRPLFHDRGALEFYYNGDLMTVTVGALAAGKQPPASFS